MLYSIITLFITIILFITGGCLVRPGVKRRRISAILTWFVLAISILFIVHLQDRIDTLEKEVVSEQPLMISSFSLDKLAPDIFESPHAQASTILKEQPPVAIPEPEPTVIPEKPPRYEFTDQDIYLMARLLCGSKHKDGDGEYDFDYGNEDRYDQISLVLCVVMNRVQDDRFPDTVEDVIMQRYYGQDYQFSAVGLWGSNNGEVSDISIQRVKEWCKAFNQEPSGTQTVPESYVYFSSNGKGINVARPKL